MGVTLSKQRVSQGWWHMAYNPNSQEVKTRESQGELDPSIGCLRPSLKKQNKIKDK